MSKPQNMLQKLNMEVDEIRKERLEINANRAIMKLASDEISNLRHYKDTTNGLWCIDRNPKDVSMDWINENAFQLK